MGLLRNPSGPSFCEMDVELYLTVDIDKPHGANLLDERFESVIIL